jgi:predicted PurR-regulated permease PerM
MVFVIGATLSVGFYLVGLNYWLLVGAFVGLVEIVPVIGPLIGAILVLAVGLPESVHVAALSLLVLVGVREFQSYVINPHVMGHSVRLASSRSSPSRSSGSSSAASRSSSRCRSPRRSRR